MTSEELFNEHYGYAVNLSRQYFGNIKCPFFDVNDAIQCGLMGLLQASKRYKPCKTSFKTFAYKRIVGSIRDNLRSFNPINRNTEAFKESDNKLFVVDTYGCDFELFINYLDTYESEDAIIRKIDEDKIHKYIMNILVKLPGQQQFVLYYTFLKGLSTHDIALALEIHDTTVCKHRIRGLENFKKFAEIYKSQPRRFQELKEHNMDELSHEYDSKQEIDYEIHVGEAWCNRRRSYNVRVVAVANDIITYTRSSPVKKNARRSRVVRVPKNIFQNKFEILEDKDIPSVIEKAKAMLHKPITEDGVRSVSQPVIDSVLPSIKGIDAIQRDKFNPIIIPYWRYHKIILELKDGSPFDRKNVDLIFNTFHSLDITYVIIADMIHHEAWADLNDTGIRNDLVTKYIDYYKSLNWKLDYSLMSESMKEDINHDWPS